MRLALMEAGLVVIAVTLAELAVVITRVLPIELESRGVANAPSVCEALRSAIDSRLSHSPIKDRPDAVFQRMGKIGVS
jgi:hypothetical protein